MEKEQKDGKGLLPFHGKLTKEQVLRSCRDSAQDIAYSTRSPLFRFEHTVYEGYVFQIERDIEELEKFIEQLVLHIEYMEMYKAELEYIAEGMRERIRKAAGTAVE